MGTLPRPAAVPPPTQTRELWVLVGFAVAQGLFGAFASLICLGVIKFGGGWYTDFRPGWFGGHWWWVAVTAAAGVIVGLLRWLTRLPVEVPGLFDDLRAQRVDTGLVPGTIVVSVMSLIGGSSVGPEKVLGTIGGGVGSWIAQRRRMGQE
ncbi:MAG: hypothetical protein ACRENX_05640 [Candidatus Dormibacteria bacterium]